ncbi:hypothetical protein DSC45_32880 [Streptomyces sp. YIM 130001]|uniref:hypothetical protein n=1 Tax=Streptomyces sp. YIM 130001 TaxID=2259644 RepID=UPI000ECEA668|nr:hypothetical protein [Streptomyces sp. YIM 130001]RII08642.1 hypothetical protein DSC45_32880 [Streptomyces sp. YIM 130001]
MPRIRAYFRRDGTKVTAHSRWPRGARRETAIFAGVCAAVVLFGNTPAATSGTARTPKPRTTAVYPVKFPGWDKPSPRPRPTVSYPIRFDDADG